MAITYADIRSLLIDPQILKLKEELYGSGIAYGRLQESKLPPTTVVVGGGGGTTDPSTLGYIKGIDVYSGGTLIGSTKKELSFLGPGISVTTNRATIDFATPLSAKVTNPMTAAGDIIYGTTGGLPTRRAVGFNGQYLAVVAGVPDWVTISGLVDPTTTEGDLLYRRSGVLARLPIGSSGQVLVVSGGEPIWETLPVTGMVNPMTARGDIIYAESGGAAYRLGIGSAGQVLTALNNIPQWITPSGGSTITVTSGTAFAQTIGDGSATTFDVNHGLGTRDLLVQVRENNAPYEYVFPNIYASGTNDTIVTFNTAPTASGYRVIVGGSGGGSSSSTYTAIVKKSTAQSIPGSTYPTWLLFDTALVNIGDMWNSGATDRLTCQRSGTYIAIACVACDGSSSAAQDTQLQISVFNADNTSTTQDFNSRAFSAYQCSMTVTGALSLTTGQYVKVNYYQTTGGTRNTLTSATSFSLIEQQ